MAKPNVAKAVADKNTKKKDPYAQPALRWQFGGLIAGVAVAILSATQPGKQVGTQLHKPTSRYLMVGSWVVSNIPLDITY